MTGEAIRTFHTVEGKTQRQAEKACNAPIVALELEGGTVGTSTTVRDFLNAFMRYKDTRSAREP